MSNVTADTAKATPDYLAELPLNIFCHCLNSNDYSKLVDYCNDVQYDSSLLNVFDCLPNSGKILSLIKSPEFNYKWKNILCQYLMLVGCDNEKAFVGCMGNMSAIHLTLIVSAANLSCMKVRYSDTFANYFKTVYNIDITPDNVDSGIASVLTECEKEVRQYNRYCAEYHLHKPQHTTAYFLSMIRKAQDRFKLFPEGTTANKIFNSITVSEFAQYVQALKANE